MPDQHPIFDNPTKSFAKVTCKGTNLKTMTRTFVVSKPENVWWGDATQDAENIRKAPLVPELVAALEYIAQFHGSKTAEEMETLRKRALVVIAKIKQL